MYVQLQIVLPAGQNLPSGPSYRLRFVFTGTESSNNVKWAGWSPSWFVPVNATEDKISKLIFPSGFGYSITETSVLVFSLSLSGTTCIKKYILITKN